MMNGTFFMARFFKDVPQKCKVTSVYVCDKTSPLRFNLFNFGNSSFLRSKIGKEFVPAVCTEVFEGASATQ